MGILNGTLIILNLENVDFFKAGYQSSWVQPAGSEQPWGVDFNVSFVWPLPSC